jgi:hypothetical protein
MFYCPKHNVIIQVAPKCGEESVRYLIFREENIENPHNIWKNVKEIQIPKSLLLIPKIICIVRNPYNRLVSGYIDKFLTGNYHHLPFCKKVKEYYKRDDDNKRITFKEFVNYIISQPYDSLDPHFKPQFLQHNLNNSVYILKLENISEIERILCIVGFKNKFINYRDEHLYKFKKKKYNNNVYDMYYKDFDIAENRNNREELRPSGCDGVGYQNANIPYYDDFYDEELKKKIYSYYKDDFKIFNYEIK